MARQERVGRVVAVRGASYVVDVVVRTLTLGHLFTEGTADSNEVWLDVVATSGGKIIGRSGALDIHDGQVDPWSHFINDQASYDNTINSIPLDFLATRSNGMYYLRIALDSKETRQLKIVKTTK